MKKYKKIKKKKTGLHLPRDFPVAASPLLGHLFLFIYLFACFSPFLSFISIHHLL